MTKYIIKSLATSKVTLFLGLVLFSLLFPTLTQAQIKLRTVADWEAGSIVLLNGHKFVKLNGPGGDGYFMAMEPLCDIPDADSIIIDQVGEGTDENFTLSVSNAAGIGPLCTWTATTSDGSPITPNWTTLPDANGRETGCTIQVPKLAEETTFTPTITGCNMGGDLTTDLIIKTTPKISEITNEQIAAMPSCTQDSCPADATIKAIDDRDGKEYTFRKLPDGKLWMVDNLAYDPNNYCDTRQTMADPNGKATASNNFGSGTYGDCVNPEYAGSVCSSGDCGYLYNWQAAMQHSTAYYNTSYSGPQTDVTGLCPTGFVLPTRDDFIALDIDFGGTGQNNQTTASLIARYRDPALYNGIFSGYSNSSGSLSLQGTSGHWWSSTEDSSTYAYLLYLNSSNVNLQNSFNKGYGLAIRCLR